MQTLKIGDVGPKGRILIRGEYGQDIIDVAVNGNLGDQIDYGLELNAEAGAGTFSGKIMYAANNFDSSVGDYRNTGTATVIPIIGFNGGTFGAQLFTGSGTPEGVVTARTGSMYLNSAGGDSTPMISINCRKRHRCLQTCALRANT